MTNEVTKITDLTGPVPDNDYVKATNIVSDMTNRLIDDAVMSMAKYIAVRIISNAMENGDGEDPSTFDMSADDCVMPYIKDIASGISELLPKCVEEAAAAIVTAAK